MGVRGEGLETSIVILASFLYPMSKLFQIYKGFFLPDLLVLSAFLVATVGPRRRELSIAIASFLPLIAIYLVSAVLSMLVGMNTLPKFDVANAIFRILTDAFPILLLVPLLVISHLSKRRIALSYMLGVAFSSLLNILAFNIDISWLPIRQLASGQRMFLYGNANEIALLSATLVAFSACFVKKSFFAFILSTVMLSIIAISTIALTASRTGLVVFVLVFFSTLFVNARKFYMVSWFNLVLIFAVALVVLIMLFSVVERINPYLFIRMSRIADGDANISSRNYVMISGIKLSADRLFILGIGPSNYATNFGLGTTIHNTFILWLTELGFFGFIVQTFFVLYPLAAVAKNIRTDRISRSKENRIEIALMISAISLLVGANSIPVSRLVFFGIYLLWMWTRLTFQSNHCECRR